MDDDWDLEGREYAARKKRDFERDHETERQTKGT